MASAARTDSRASETAVGSLSGAEPIVDGAAPPRSRWVGFFVLAAGLAMIVLDGTVVNVALPAIIDDLDLALTEAQWVTSLYAVVFAALLLTSGRLGDRHGRRLMFLIGVGVFVAASLAAAGANDSGELIWSRCAQASAQPTFCRQPSRP